MSLTEVEAWLARPPGPENVQNWAEARLTVAEAERLREEVQQALRDSDNTEVDLDKVD
jgi:hypothetical protein